MRHILDDLRVVEFSAFVAVPLAGMTLAQLGADVVRIDPLGGGVDAGRWPITDAGRSLYWASLNRGKRSATLDLRSQRGQDLALEAAARAGIAITNLPYDWFDVEELTSRRPDMITLRLVGNPDGSPAVDYTVNAAVGLPHVTGTGDEPVNHVLPAWDVITGHHIVSSVIAADRHRLQTGEGTHLRLSLADVAMATVANLGYLAEVEINDTDRSPIGNDLYGSFGSRFETADSRSLMVVAMTKRQWTSLLAVTRTAPAVERLEEQLAADFDREGSRFTHRAAIKGLMEGWFSARSLDQAGAELDQAGVLWGPYQTFRQLLESDPRCSPDNPLFDYVDHPDIGRTLRPGYPTMAVNPETGPVGRAPDLGAHTSEILAALDVKHAAIELLRQQGVIG